MSSTSRHRSNDPSNPSHRRFSGIHLSSKHPWQGSPTSRSARLCRLWRIRCRCNASRDVWCARWFRRAGDEHDCEHPERLWGVCAMKRALWRVQIWDNDPDTMAKVGKRLVEEYAVSVVDINFGCPVKQVTEKAHSGSYLLRDPERCTPSFPNWWKHVRRRL